MDPAHPKAEAHVDAWIDATGIGEEGKPPLFRTFGGDGEVTVRPLYEAGVLRMVKVRGPPGSPPTSRTEGTIEKAQAIAAHASPRTTKHYDRASDAIALEEIEKIGI